tara:strand:+ start:609 stop:773 length:165 start_codon:yes stop_codon:yes gene_type:complete
LLLQKYSDYLLKEVISLSDKDFMPPIELLKQSFLLGDMKNHPVLYVPTDKSLQS